MVEVKKRNLLVAPLTASLVFCNLAVAANAVEVEAESPVVINEVESNSDPVGDWVELANTDNNNSIDISGWSLVDDKEDLENALVLPEGTEIESGGYFVIYTDSADYVPTNNTFGGQEYFGLGKDDTVTLRNAEGEVVATYSWKDLGEHAENTYGRIPDMTGDFANTGVPTPGAKNVAAEGSGEEEGVVANAQLPFHNVEITPIHLGGDFTGEDMSGVDFDANSTAWIANNDIGKIYSLAHDIANNTYKLTGEWETGYPEGGGEPDAEGIVAATNGDIYLSTERNNADKNVSRPSILRFATPTGKTGYKTQFRNGTCLSSSATFSPMVVLRQSRSSRTTSSLSVSKRQVMSSLLIFPLTSQFWFKGTNLPSTVSCRLITTQQPSSSALCATKHVTACLKSSNGMARSCTSPTTRSTSVQQTWATGLTKASAPTPQSLNARTATPFLSPATSGLTMQQPTKAPPSTP